MIIGTRAASAQETEPEETEPEETEPGEQEAKKTESKEEMIARLTKEGLNCKFAIYGNLASWAFNGQTLNLEYGKKGSIALRLRFLNLGLISGDAFEYNAEEKFSPGFGLALRGYFTRKEGNLRGYFLGIAVEQHIFRAALVEFDWMGVALVPSVETGYRWVVGRYVIGLGAGIGWGFQVYERNEYWFGYTTNDNRLGYSVLEGLVFEGILEMGGIF